MAQASQRNGAGRLVLRAAVEGAACRRFEAAGRYRNEVQIEASPSGGTSAWDCWTLIYGRKDKARYGQCCARWRLCSRQLPPLYTLPSSMKSTCSDAGAGLLVVHLARPPSDDHGDDGGHLNELGQVRGADHP